MSWQRPRCSPRPSPTTLRSATRRSTAPTTSRPNYYTGCWVAALQSALSRGGKGKYAIVRSKPRRRKPEVQTEQIELDWLSQGHLVDRIDWGDRCLARRIEQHVGRPSDSRSRRHCSASRCSRCSLYCGPSHAAKRCTSSGRFARLR